MTEKELWLPVEGWEGYYEVSNHGQIRSLPRIITSRRGAKKAIPGRVMRKNLQKNKAAIVSFNRKGKPIAYRVDHLVYKSFIGEIPPGKTVFHLDGDKDNDHVDNLDLRDILMDPLEQKRLKNSNGRISDRQIREMRRLYDKEQVSSVEIAKLFRISAKSAYSVCKRQTYQWVLD